MEAAAVGVGEAALSCLLSGAKAAIADDAALRQSVQRDAVFLTDELAAMNSFLRDADEERNRHKIPRSRVRQVQDLAYDVDDCLQDYAVHLEKPSGWRLARTVLERHRIAEEMKGLRARAEDMSHRNLRYHFAEDVSSKSKLAISSESSSIPLGIGTKRQDDLFFESGKVDLVPLICTKDQELRVIVVWGTSGDPWKTTIVRKAYDDLKRKDVQFQEDEMKKFECHAWVRIMHPFNPSEFLQCVMRQFYVNSLQEEAKTQEETTLGAQVQNKMEVMNQGDLVLQEEAKTQEETTLGAQVQNKTEAMNQGDLVLQEEVKIQEETTLGTQVQNKMEAMNQGDLVLQEEAKIQEETTLGAQVQSKMEAMNQGDLVKDFNKHVTQKTYLIVLNDLSTIEDWDWIKTYFPNNKNGSRIIVSTEQCEVASLCAGPERLVVELKQSSADQIIYAFCEKGTRTAPMAITQQRFSRIETMEDAPQESQFIGRQNEVPAIINLISNNDNQHQVIVVCGKNGLGKTTLVQSVYQKEDLRSKFEKIAYVTIKHPFNRKDLLCSLAKQLGDKEVSGCSDRTKLADRQHLISSLEGEKYLIVLDGLSSATEWDAIKDNFPKTEASRIVLTTSTEKMAKYCSNDKDDNIYRLKILNENDAKNLFIKKVFGRIIDLDPELARESKLILNKCNGFPLAILTIGGVLKKRSNTAVEWRKLNEYIDPDKGTNLELDIRIILAKCYDCLPYELKSCFLYLSIFPEDHNISRRRLVHRWTAEGYSMDGHGKSGKEIADGYFMELIDRSMILPFVESVGNTKGIDSCKFNDLIHQMSTLKSAEENLVFRLEDGCVMNTKKKFRHLSVSDTWNGDQADFENIVDPSSIRSLTVFAKWRPFFISEKMRMLRVLDLEGTSGLTDHHLEYIGNLVHLKYLSLRHCSYICRLPHSLGNLRQLETLDIKDTCIIKLPRAIIRLRKLQYLRAGGAFAGNSYEEFVEDMGLPKPLQKKLCLLPLCLAACCVTCCAPQTVKEDIWDEGGDPNRCDICTAWCCSLLPFLASGLDGRGVVVPSGFNKLTALHTLGTVNIGRGRAALQGIERLTRLRKLGVAGVTKKKYKDLSTALSALTNLESLSVRSMREPGDDGSPSGNLMDLSPPESLKRLKLYGPLCELPQWVISLRNLMKLSLKDSFIPDHVAAMNLLGSLPKLSILRIQRKSFKGDEGVCLSFDDCQAFPSLKVLLVMLISDLKSVEFKQGSTPKLEVLQFCGFPYKTNSGFFSGLASLPRLKEFMLDNDTYDEDFLKDVKKQLKDNSNRPILKRY